MLGVKERIRQIRHDMKLTQTAFAARIGVTRDVVASWESGRVEPPEAVVRLLCRDLAISYDWLRYGQEPRDVPENMMVLDKLERIMTGDNAFVKTVFRELADLPADAWERIGAMVDRLYDASHPRR